MKTVKVWGSYFGIRPMEENLIEWYTRMYTPMHINVVITPEDPDILIVSNQIYFDKKQMDTFIHYKEKGVITIYYSYEIMSADFNLFDYVINVDAQLSNGDRYIQLPLFIWAHNCIFEDFLSPSPPRVVIRQKTEFCNFIYGNSRAPSQRDALFHKISTYKKVDSLGKHLNNKPEVQNNPKQKAYADGWERISIQLKEPYKFSIAAENGYFEGYTSEKIITSFQANTIPIYWGNRLIHEDFNPKAFINCHDYQNFDEVLEVVKKIDQNDDLWLEIMSRPRCLPWQIEKHLEEEEKFRQFFTYIFEQDKEQAQRAPYGTSIDMYLEFLKHSHDSKIPLKTQIRNKIIYKLCNIASNLGLKKKLP